MRRTFQIVCAGGGPAGLYFSILMRKAFPEVDITVHERNRPDDTFGWGVVFSDETLSRFEQADPQSFARITEQFAYWDDIETRYADTCVRSTGHGFCGLSRKRLLQIFHDRCRELGVALRFQSTLERIEDAGPVDLVLVADGVNSGLRTQLEEHFRLSLSWGTTRFCWLGCDKHLEAFTFIFKESEHGLFQVHAYPFERNLSTFIVECHEDTWRRAGLDQADEQQTVRYCEELFAEHLEGARLLTNRSIWRSFPTVRNERWHHGNVVLIGDAAHTAHFSIGSGTKLAMEDAIALADAFRELGLDNVPAVLGAYQEARYLDCIKLQRAARTSRQWFENSARYVGQHPLQFTFNLLTRSKRITWENLRLRDPELVDQVDAWFAREQAHHAPPADAPLHPSYGTPEAQRPDEAPSGAPSGEAHGDEPPPLKAPPPMFAPLRLRSMQLANRVVVSPMCQYSATDGVVGDWHVVHLGSRAVGGAGLVITEMTDVSSEGRITPGCAGLWNDEQERAWRRVVDFVHAHSAARIGIQLAHAGRKASCDLPWLGGEPLTDERAWPSIGPSALPFDLGWPRPREMDRDDLDRVREAFVEATRRAERAGFDLIELHMAHGYLLSSFLSPLSNARQDEYGGSLENRMRYPLEVFEAVRAAWPQDKPLAVRISATDWLDEQGGLTDAEAVRVAAALEERGLDLIDVSTAGNVPESRPDYGRMYQVPFAERIRHETGLRVMAVGAILGPDHVNTILAAGRADLCALARPHLADPQLTLRASIAYEQADWPWPKQYLAARPRPRSS
jgi:anthraniloyl-CoA monooxygenase